jgi:TPP-dependent pyruvate/acetoin dehydrogenase alpha subunit
MTQMNQRKLGSDTTAFMPIDLAGLPREELPGWLHSMLVIREFEETADKLALRGKIPGGVHVSAGQEAVAVGTVRALEPQDIIAGGHRSHHHALAKGLSADAVMAELFGKSTGVVGGRGGTMHLADFATGYYGGNGIVGGGLGIAMGAALGAQIRQTDQVAVGFVGDGGANTGRVWENINLAAIWKLPHIVVCENNLYAVETHTDRVTAAKSIAHRAAGFGLPSLQVDGQDIGELYRTMKAARKRAAAGEGPTFIEARTYRYHGHNTGDVITYRTADELERWRSTKDPILRFSAALERDGLLAAGQFDEIQRAAGRIVEDAVRFAEESPWPELETLDNVSAWNGRVRGNI